MRRILPIFLIVLMAAMPGCGPASNAPQPITPIIPSTPAGELPTLTPPPAPPTATTLASLPTATEAGSAAPRPLPADLFYQTDQGQVFRQPAGGDEKAASLISPPGEVVTDFAVAPGGEWLLTRSGGAITALALDGQAAQSVAEGTGAPADVTRGQTMAWSPDGSKIAFTDSQGFELKRSALGYAIPIADTFVIDLRWSPDSRWLVAWADSAQAMVCDTRDPALFRCVDLGSVNGYAWLSDGRLAFAPAEGGLALADPSAPQSQVFLVPKEQPVSHLYPRADGSLAFFIHALATEGLAELYEGDPVHLTYQPASQSIFQIYRQAWDVSGRWLTAPAPGASSIDLVDPVTRTTASIPTAGPVKSLAWGEPTPRSVSSLPLPGALYFLAPQAGITQVWKMPPTGDLPASITSASADVTAFDISPDGKKVTYTSGGAIFAQTINANDATQIALLGPDAHSPTGTPAFSPTGRRVAYANNGIWVYDTAAQSVIRLAPDSPPDTPPDQVRVYDHPRWSPDGKWMLVTAHVQQGADSAVMPSGGNSISVATLNQLDAQAEWGADSTILVYGEGGALGPPQVSRILPWRPRSPKMIIDAPVVDVQERADGRLAVLRSPGPLPFGPASVRIFSVKADGSDPQAETGSMVVEKPLLSPDAVLVAGLVRAATLADGTLAGQLVIINPATGQVFVVEGLTAVHDLLWGK